MAKIYANTKLWKNNGKIVYFKYNIIIKYIIRFKVISILNKDLNI